MTESENISPTYFEWISKVADEILGPEHPVSKLCREAHSSNDPESVVGAMTAVRKMPKKVRDDILLSALSALAASPPANNAPQVIAANIIARM